MRLLSACSRAVGLLLLAHSSLGPAAGGLPQRHRIAFATYLGGKEVEQGRVEVAAVDPIASMAAVDNPELGGIALQVQAKLKRVVDSL